MRSTPLRTTVTAIALASAATAGITGCSGSGANASAAGVITMTSDACGGSWHVPGPGQHTFEVRNGNDVGGEVDLIDPRTGGIYSEIMGFGPKTTTPMSLNVGSGEYAFRCLFQDTDPMTGPTVTVAGHTAGARAIVPVTYNDLIPAAKTYQNYVEAGLKTLNSQVTALDSDVASGYLAKARGDWLTGHLQYETLGAAYDAFGPYDDEIDGRADALGVSSPRWTGFYRLEYGLWHGQSAAELKPVAAKLRSDVSALLKWWPSQEIELIDIGLRTHEILENALQFQLTGHDDYGSGTTLGTTLANVRGTDELLSLLRPLLKPRYPGLPAAAEWLGRLQSLLQKQVPPNAPYKPVSSLPASTRADIVAACDQALEELAPIASITEPRNT
jgi:iron uptake system EfeUOB component EfeO/EfeM